MTQLDFRLRKEVLRAFLVERRARLEPEDVGLPRRPARSRSPGLRQHEVAELLGMSTKWYALFETGSLDHDVSFVLVQRVADILRLDERDRAMLARLALPAIERASEHLERSAYDGALRDLRQIQEFARKVGSASSFEEAALLAVETSQRVLAPDCLSVHVPEHGEHPASDYARGPRARYWGRLSQQIGYEQHRGLPSAKVAISENIVLPEEAQGATTLVRFMDAEDDSSSYEFECATEQWNEINRVRMRSCVVVSVREAGEYRGILSVCWAKPRELLPVEVELFATIGAIVDLTASRSDTHRKVLPERRDPLHLG